MSLIHSAVGAIWNTATSYFPATAKYCADNNINWVTTGNIAMELASFTVLGPLAAAQNSGKAVMTAVAASVVGAIPAWTYSAKDVVAHAAHSVLAAPHAWTFGGDPTQRGDSATMAKELAVAAGDKALHLGCHAFQSIHTRISEQADEFMNSWTEALNEAEHLLRSHDMLPGADAAAVTTPVFSWDDEDLDCLLNGSLQHFPGDPSAGQHALVQPAQALATACEDFDWQDVPLPGPQLGLVGIDAASDFS